MPMTRYPITVDGQSTDIGTAAELVVALDVLQGQYDRLVLQQLAPHLAEIVGGPPGLYSVLKVLSGDDQLYLIDALGPALLAAISSAAALRDLLAALSDQRVEERLLETIDSPGLSALLGSAEELAEVLEWVYGDCDQLALRLLGPDTLRRLCLGGYELSLVLHALDETRQMELLDTLGWRWVLTLIHDRRDLAYLLRALPADLSQRLLDHLTDDRLAAVLRDDADWRYLLPFLEEVEAAYLTQRLGVIRHAQ
jgi:hypothetical protein